MRGRLRARVRVLRAPGIVDMGGASRRIDLADMDGEQMYARGEEKAAGEGVRKRVFMLPPSMRGNLRGGDTHHCSQARIIVVEKREVHRRSAQCHTLALFERILKFHRNSVLLDRAMTGRPCSASSNGKEE